MKDAFTVIVVVGAALVLDKFLVETGFFCALLGLTILGISKIRCRGKKKGLPILGMAKVR